MTRYLWLLLVAGCKLAGKTAERDMTTEYNLVHLKIDSVRHLALVGAVLAMPGAIILYLWVVRPLLRKTGIRKP